MAGRDARASPRPWRTLDDDFSEVRRGDVALDYTCDDLLAERHDVILDIGGNTTLTGLRRALKADGVLVFVGGEHEGT